MVLFLRCLFSNSSMRQILIPCQTSRRLRFLLFYPNAMFENLMVRSSELFCFISFSIQLEPAIYSTLLARLTVSVHGRRWSCLPMYIHTYVHRLVHSKINVLPVRTLVAFQLDCGTERKNFKRLYPPRLYYFLISSLSPKGERAKKITIFESVNSVCTMYIYYYQLS